MIQPVSQFMTGFLSPLSGMALVFSSRKMFILSLIPFLIGLMFVLTGFVLASQYIIPLVEGWHQNIEFIQKSEFLLKAVTVVVLIFSWVAISLLNFLIGYLAIIIIAGPFYALLAEDIFRSHHRMMEKRNSLALVTKMFFLALVKVVFFLFIGLICFVLSFVPIVNIFSTFFMFLVVAYDLTDYSFEIDYLNLRKSFRFLFSHLFEYSGLALAISCTTLLPGSFFILLPAFICGATKMYIQLANKAV